MKDKFFHIKTNYPYSNNKLCLEQFGKNLYVSFDEDCEKKPSIDIHVGSQVKFDIPVAGEYCQVTHITFEKYNSYYLNTLRSLINFFPINSEYYFNHSAQECSLQCYSDNRYLKIKINYKIGYFRCTIYSSGGIRGRNGARKNYNAISEEVAKQIFNITIELLHDCNNCSNLVEEYYNQIGLLIKDEEPIKDLTFNLDAVFDEVRLQIIDRVKSIENRMINFDDTVESRNELRGELKGLKFCMKILDSNR